MDLFPFLIINLFASFFQGITGFGSALIASPLSLLVLDKFIVVSSLSIIGLVLNAFLFWKIKQPINLKLLIPLCLASVIGMPFGIWILKTVPINLIQIIAGSLAILFTLIIFFTKISLPQNKIFISAAGLFSGLLQTSISMSGPPAVMLLASISVEKNQMRKTLAAFFLWMNLISLPFFIFSKTISFQSVSFGLYTLPFVFLGAYLGNKVVEKIPQKSFRLLVLATICLTGFLSIYSALSL